MAQSKHSGVHIKVTSPHEGILLVLFSRPPVNAFHKPMWQEIGTVFRSISTDSSVRAVVLSSSTRMFTAGLDLTATEDLTPASDDPARSALAFLPLIQEFQDAISAIENCPVPVIAAVHNLAYGIAVDILTACDIRYATTDAKFAVKEVDIGMASDVGSLARLPKIGGNESAHREWSFTGRDIDVREAEKAGFVSKVVEGGKDQVIAAALETAKLIATKSPVAVIGTKHLLLHSRDHGVQENLDYTATWNAAMLQSHDMTKIIASFKKRTPSKL